MATIIWSRATNSRSTSTTVAKVGVSSGSRVDRQTRAQRRAIAELFMTSTQPNPRNTLGNNQQNASAGDNAEVQVGQQEQQLVPIVDFGVTHYFTARSLARELLQ